MPESTAPRKQVIDFTNVKDRSGINPKHRPAGDYRVKITAVTEEESKKSHKPQWLFAMTTSDMLSATYPYYCQLEEATLWKIRNLLIACGIDVPKKRVNVDPNKLLNRELGVTLEDDEYEGKMKSVITAVFPASELDDQEAPADDETEEEAEETEDVSEEDMEELDVEDL